MIITKIESFSVTQVGLVRITTDAGIFGWGQISTFDVADIAAQVLHRLVAPVVLGEDPFAIEEINRKILERNLKYPGTFVCRALGAVDSALWDLRGRYEKKPVWGLLGTTGKPVPVYGSSMSRKITPADENRRLNRLQSECGYRAFKIRVGSGAGRNEDAWPRRTEELISSVGRGLSSDTVIHADANSAYTPEGAIRVGKLLEENGLKGHFEEPCPYWELDWTKEVTDALTISVAGGEQDNYLPTWRQMVRDHVVDILQPDIFYLGGISRTLQVARMAQDHGLLCVPHSANHSLVTVCTAHMWNAVGSFGPFMEFSIEDQFRFHEMFSPPLEIVDGNLPIPDEGCGWGVSINEAWLKRSEYRVSELEDA
jgi:L-alanine-DL-glutamate epimerase-like enolase superfamily enzyme